MVIGDGKDKKLFRTGQPGISSMTCMDSSMIDQSIVAKEVYTNVACISKGVDLIKVGRYIERNNWVTEPEELEMLVKPHKEQQSLIDRPIITSYWGNEIPVFLCQAPGKIFNLYLHA